MDCKFCAIVNNELEKFSVFENKDFIAFLDVRPLFLGHCLFAPKLHIQTLYDLPDSLVESYFINVKKMGKAVEKAMNAEGSFIAINNIVSQSVPHLHTHIVPRNKGDGLKGFFWPRTSYASPEEMHEIQERIKRAFIQQ